MNEFVFALPCSCSYSGYNHEGGSSPGEREGKLKITIFTAKCWIWKCHFAMIERLKYPDIRRGERPREWTLKNVFPFFVPGIMSSEELYKTKLNNWN